MSLYITRPVMVKTAVRFWSVMPKLPTKRCHNVGRTATSLSGTPKLCGICLLSGPGSLRMMRT
jgi:hypothetical protein